MFSLYFLNPLYQIDIARIRKDRLPVVAELSACYVEKKGKHVYFFVSVAAGHHADSDILLYRVKLRWGKEMLAEPPEITRVELPREARTGENRDPFFYRDRDSGALFLSWVHTDYTLKKIRGKLRNVALGSAHIRYVKVLPRLWLKSRVLARSDSNLAYPWMCDGHIIFSKVEGITLRGYAGKISSGPSGKLKVSAIFPLSLPVPVEEPSCVYLPAYKSASGVYVVAFRNFSTLRIYRGKNLSSLEPVDLPSEYRVSYVMSPRLSVDLSGKYRGVLLSFHSSKDSYVAYSSDGSTFGKPLKINLRGKYVRAKNPYAVWLGNYLFVFFAVEYMDFWIVKVAVYYR